MWLLRTLLLCVVLVLTACGGGGDGGHGTPTFTTQILSDPLLDGDIGRDLQGNLTITEGNPELIFAGIRPDTGEEFRAFINFHLDGPGGVPGNAIISSAFLDLKIENLLTQLPGDTVPIRIDLVSYQPPLDIAFFSPASLPPLVSVFITPPLALADLNQHVPVDITPLMQEAQRLGLSEFQIRLLRDPGGNLPGLVVIDDTTGPDRSQLAPLLEVTYF